MATHSTHPTGTQEGAAPSPSPPAQSVAQGATTGDAFVRLVEEHRALERLLDEIASTSDTDENKNPVIRAAENKALILRLSAEITAHEDVEASVLGPTIRSRLDGGRRLSRSQRRHYRQTEKVLALITRRSMSSPDLPVLLTQIDKSVHELVAQQESTVFPQVRGALHGDELGRLCHRLESAQHHATTRPHPYLSHRGSVARLVRAGVAVLDRLRNRLTPRL
ncbi:MAG: hemerythrin domain-containing protein [Acidimicrobiales bacterium]